MSATRYAEFCFDKVALGLRYGKPLESLAEVVAKCAELIRRQRDEHHRQRINRERAEQPGENSRIREPARWQPFVLLRAQ